MIARNCKLKPFALKMDRISRNLIFEVARFLPTCLFPLAATSTALNALVSGDVSYVHTLLEETFENIK
jgi:hypothetical protein